MVVIMFKSSFVVQVLLALSTIFAVGNSETAYLKWSKNAIFQGPEIKEAILESGIFEGITTEQLQILEIAEVDTLIGKSLLLCTFEATERKYCFFAAVIGLNNAGFKIRFTSIGSLHPVEISKDEQENQQKRVKKEAESYAITNRAFTEVWTDEDLDEILKKEINQFQLHKYWVVQRNTKIVAILSAEGSTWGFVTFAISKTGTVSKEFFTNISRGQIYSAVAKELANELAFYHGWNTKEEDLKEYSELDNKINFPWASNKSATQHSLYAVTKRSDITGSIHILSAIYPMQFVFALWSIKEKSTHLSMYLHHVSAPCSIEEAAEMYSQLLTSPWLKLNTMSAFELTETTNILVEADLLDPLKNKILEEKPALTLENLQLKGFRLIPTMANEDGGTTLQIKCGNGDSTSFYVFAIINVSSSSIKIISVGSDTSFKDEYNDQVKLKLREMYKPFYSTWKREDVSVISYDEMEGIQNFPLLSPEVKNLSPVAVFKNDRRRVIIAKYSAGGVKFIYATLNAFGDSGRLKVTSVGPGVPQKDGNETNLFLQIMVEIEYYINRPYAFAEDWASHDDQCADEYCENLLARCKIGEFKEVRIHQDYTVKTLVLKQEVAYVRETKECKTRVEVIDQLNIILCYPTKFIENPVEKAQVDLTLFQDIDLGIVPGISMDNLLIVAYGAEVKKNAILAFEPEAAKSRPLIFTEFSESRGKYIRIGKPAYFHSGWNTLGVGVELVQFVSNPITFKACSILLSVNAPEIQIASQQKLLEVAPWVFSIGLGISVLKQMDVNQAFPNCVLETWAAEVGHGPTNYFFVVWKNENGNSQRLLYVSELRAEWNIKTYTLIHGYTHSPLAFQEEEFNNGIAWYDNENALCQKEMKRLLPLMREKANPNWTISDNMFNKWKFGRIVSLLEETKAGILTYCLFGEISVGGYGIGPTQFISVIVKMKHTEYAKYSHHIAFGKLRDSLGQAGSDVIDFAQRRIKYALSPKSLS